jgi:uncharacterized protein (TIGR03790 family)
MNHKVLLVLLAAFVVLCHAASAPAGGGPENVCLVVNPDSPDSLAIANHYCQLRHIPPSNVVYIPFPPETPATDVNVLRDKILRPVLAALDHRGLTPQIDYIVYSCDFPWIVYCAPDVDQLVRKIQQAKKGFKWPPQIGTTGSLTALTYLYSRVLAAGEPNYLLLTANRCARVTAAGEPTAESMGFRGTLGFDESGEVVDSGGERYLLATMLAVMSNKDCPGLSIPEAKTYLALSAAADGTQPRGTIFFTRTSDVRTTARAAAFPRAQEALRKLGVASEVISTSLPVKRNDVLGLTCGVPTFTWPSTGSTLLPGALCDNLTSYGGLMNRTHEQTVMAEFLRHGAAGACGTITEPFLSPQLVVKFPSPMLHAYYAAGCSMAEAFYQSLRAPYQQLIIGDALCQPFARIPRVTVPDIKPGQRVRGVLTLRPEATIPPKTPEASTTAKSPAGGQTVGGQSPGVELPGTASSEQIDHFELFVDGVRGSVAKPGEPLSLDTAKLGDGYHELRIVAVGPSPIFTQGRAIVWIVAANHAGTITAATPSNRAPLGETLEVTAKSPGAKQIEVRHNGRTLETIHGDSGTAKIPAARLGGGFNYLQVVGIYGDRPEETVFARPIILRVE